MVSAPVVLSKLVMVPPFFLAVGGAVVVAVVVVGFSPWSNSARRRAVVVAVLVAVGDPVMVAVGGQRVVVDDELLGVGEPVAVGVLVGVGDAVMVAVCDLGFVRPGTPGGWSVRRRRFLVAVGDPVPVGVGHDRVVAELEFLAVGQSVGSRGPRWRR